MKYLLFLLLFLFSFLASAQNATVVDEANLFHSQERSRLDQYIRAIYNQGGPQIAIITVQDLGETPIEEYSIRLAEKWQLGSKEKDNGLMLVIAPNNRKIRIEVGGGIEGEITDYDSSMIINKILKPAFKKGAYFEGAVTFLNVVTEKFQIKITEEGFTRSHHYGSTKGSHFIILLVIFIILIILSRFNRYSTGFYGSGRRSGYYGGYSSGGSSSSSGWSGGGGGFSGGGSSGDW